MSEPLNGKTILITGAARQVGKIFAVACARGGTDVVIHCGHSDAEAEEVRNQIIGNVTAPFLLRQAFAKQAENRARLVNILDWRALRSGADHFPYPISKAALAAMTKSLAVALAPKILVNGLALGAILPRATEKTKPIA